MPLSLSQLGRNPSKQRKPQSKARPLESASTNINTIASRSTSSSTGSKTKTGIHTGSSSTRSNSIHNITKKQVNKSRGKSTSTSTSTSTSSTMGNKTSETFRSDNHKRRSRSVKGLNNSTINHNNNGSSSASHDGSVISHGNGSFSGRGSISGSNSVTSTQRGGGDSGSGSGGGATMISREQQLQLNINPLLQQNNQNQSRNSQNNPQLQQQQPSIHPRPRSISPHARAVLRRTFTRSRSRSVSSSSRRILSAADDDDDGNSSVASSNSASSRSSSSSRSRSSSSSRSRSRSRSRGSRSEAKQMLVAVTSCKSDAYYAQKAPGAISMLPRKAPSALKTFHELAVGMKDAYEAVGATPMNPKVLKEGNRNANINGNGSGNGNGGHDIEWNDLPRREQEGRTVLWDFMGNINFLLKLVDEVATDSATRGALKDDAAFKSIRDVIKKCNKVLERMLVRRESKYTLFYRLVQPHDAKDIGKMSAWNQKVDKAVSTLSDEQNAQNQERERKLRSQHGAGKVDNSDDASVSSSGSGMFRNRRGRGSSAGRTRSRRATPTPRLRNRFRRENSNSNSKDGSVNNNGAAASASTSADDGYATVTVKNVAKLQTNDNGPGSLPQQFVKRSGMQAQNPIQPPKLSISPIAPKDELVGMIQDLRSEANNANGMNGNGGTGNDPSDLKPNWMPKADVPATVPKLPIEYIHRHRLMKQVVNSLINRPGFDGNTTTMNSNGNGNAKSDKKNMTHIITSITSRHADKAGNGKTTLAAAAIQSVEVRERFGDGIAWIQLGRAPLNDKDIRRLYEELYNQLLTREIDLNGSGHGRKAQDTEKEDDGNALIASVLLKSRTKFQGSDLEGMKESLSRMLCKKNVLICLDDVWRVDDAKHFIFEKMEDEQSSSPSETPSGRKRQRETCPYRILLTTRTPGLMGDENSNEIFVRIFSEQEAVKLLLSSGGRRLYGGKNSPVFNEARAVVKGCGNSPLALRLAGGMLRNSNRNWVLTSQTWYSLIEQCKASLEEASRIRSFMNSLGRVVDLSFMTVEDLCLRASLRRSFVTFAMVFHNNDSLLTGRGIPRGVVRKLFFNVISGIEFESNTDVVSPDTIIEMLERMNLVQRAGHDLHLDDDGASRASKSPRHMSQIEEGPDDELAVDSADSEDKVICHKLSYVMHASIKHIAAEMASRKSSAFAPIVDNYTVFHSELDVELQRQEKIQSNTWFSNAAKYLFSSKGDNSSNATTESQFHELMVCALMSEHEDDKGDPSLFDGDNVEKYIVTHLPTHLIRAQMYTKSSEILLDRKFIDRRIEALGCLEASQYQMFDLLSLRKHHHKSTKGSAADGESTPHGEYSSSKSVDTSGNQSSPSNAIDAGKTVREGSRRMVDAIRAKEIIKSPNGKTIDFAVCLSTIGEGLLKSRQTKEATIRLEETLHMFRDLLGSYHVEVARSLHALAKAFIKTGDETTALMNLSEASRIYESCDATQHYDSIATAQLMASLLVNRGDWEDAGSKYDEVILLKSRLYGEASIPVAKSMNDYAIVLAKHSRMSEALRQYEAARSVFQRLCPTSLDAKIEDVSPFAFDITLIDLNIASIKSKLANYEGALESYERGVQGLRLHIQKEESGPDALDLTRQAAQKRHLVSAIGRIGSLRMKLRNNEGALQAYLMLLTEVDESSPVASLMEKAKAHVKCATIYRQLGSMEHNRRAVSHLKEAQIMYTEIHGPSHKDTKAISSSLKQWLKADKASAS